MAYNSSGGSGFMQPMSAPRRPVNAPPLPRFDKYGGNNTGMIGPPVNAPPFGGAGTPNPDRGGIGGGQIGGGTLNVPPPGGNPFITGGGLNGNPNIGRTPPPVDAPPFGKFGGPPGVVGGSNDMWIGPPVGGGEGQYVGPPVGGGPGDMWIGPPVGGGISGGGLNGNPNIGRTPPPVDAPPFGFGGGADGGFGGGITGGGLFGPGGSRGQEGMRRSMLARLLRGGGWGG